MSCECAQEHGSVHEGTGVCVVVHEDMRVSVYQGESGRGERGSTKEKKSECSEGNRFFLLY